VALEQFVIQQPPLVPMRLIPAVVGLKPQAAKVLGARQDVQHPHQLLCDGGVHVANHCQTLEPGASGVANGCLCTDGL
jgi:hypothetical protein